MRVTVTGLERADLISKLPLNSGLEYAVLWSPKRCGTGRYPTYRELISILDGLDGRGALHVCSAPGRQQLVDGELSDAVRFVDRIQVNGLLDEEWVLDLCDLFPRHEIITQTRGQGTVLRHNHSMLFDCSGGRGVLPEKWVWFSDRAVGFAGGLSPENLAAELPKIRKVAHGDWWIDMESSLRVDDEFSSDRVWKLVRVVDELRKSHGATL